MIKVLPSILAADMLHMGNDIDRMVTAGADGVHVDIMDGHFVPNLSYGPALVSALRKQYPGLYQDVHLMMDNPEKYLEVFAASGADAITIHAEIDGNTGEMLENIRKMGVKAGISVKPGTEAEKIMPVLPLCDLVLVMTVEPGFGGQKFMHGMMPKIRKLREAGYQGQIMVDGGVNTETAKMAVEAGADALVMGTGLVKAENPVEIIRKCKELEEKP